MSKRRFFNFTLSKKNLIVFVVLLLLGGGLIFAYLFQQNIFYSKAAVKPFQPVLTNINATDTPTAIRKDLLLSQTLDKLQTRLGVAPMTASWYVLQGSIQSQSPLQSDKLSVSDQILLLNIYVDTSQKEMAASIIDRIQRDFRAENGYLIEERELLSFPNISINPKVVVESEHNRLPRSSANSYKLTVDYLEALFRYYSRWGGPGDLELIREYMSLIYKKTDSATFFPGTTSIEISTPTPLPSGGGEGILDYDKDQVSKGGSISILPLASLNLETYRMMAVLDSDYQPLYEKAVSVLENGIISERVPLFAATYSPEDGGYQFYWNDTTEADLLDSLEITLYLARAGRAPENTILWIKSQLLNNQALFDRYDFTSGLPTTDSQSTMLYCLAMQIAKATDDAELYEAAVKILERRLATSDTSPIRGMIYKTLPEERISVYGEDNLQTWLALA